MTEIDAKQKMKDRMAAMRAKRVKKPAAPKAKKEAKYAASAAAAVLPALKEEQQKQIAELENEGIKIPELKPKFWMIKTLADLCMVPEVEVPYIVYFLNQAFIVAIRQKKSIDYVVWHENRSIEIKHKGEDAFE